MNIHALCICRARVFLCRGVVMEQVLHLQRSGVGGNFFHTLEPKTFFVGSVFVPTSFIGFVTTIPSASTMHPPKEHRCHRLSPTFFTHWGHVRRFHGFHRAFQFRLLSSFRPLRQSTPGLVVPTNVHRRMITSLLASSFVFTPFETSFQFPFSSFHSFVSTSNQIGSPSSPNFPMIIFIAIGGGGF